MNLDSVIGHCYGGEMRRMTMWRDRLDRTSSWAVTLIGALLTWGFSTTGDRDYIFLIGMVLATVLLTIEARRYRAYDVWRSRLRLIEENVIAKAFDPSASDGYADWSTEISEDYREPSFKIPLREALANRPRRVYLALFLTLLLAWVLETTALSSGGWLEAAGIGSIPGIVVVGILAVFYGTLLRIAFWPHKRYAKGKLDEEEVGKWKDTG